MDAADIESDLEYRGALRGGGWVGVTPDRLVVAHPGEDAVYVDYDDVATIRVEPIDWFLVVMSLALVGFGLLSLQRNLLGGVAFAVAGGISLYFTYGRRGRVNVSAEGESKTLKFFPEDVDELKRALDPYVEGSAGWERED
ncbi:hypothetical protein [Haloarchaeobius sp. HRN-SO-5]|uniref:hypothetical protein n=1 Tax=Haloarchaeobius sp. HRN-SO-5 TaxID=3446118 RepID=UPI003EBF67E2